MSCEELLANPCATSALRTDACTRCCCANTFLMWPLRPCRVLFAGLPGVPRRDATGVPAYSGDQLRGVTVGVVLHAVRHWGKVAAAVGCSSLAETEPGQVMVARTGRRFILFTLYHVCMFKRARWVVAVCVCVCL